MNRKILILAALICVLLCGCSWLDGSYVHVTPHEEGNTQSLGDSVSASSYSELKKLLENMVETGQESTVIYVSDFDTEALDTALRRVHSYICKQYPVGAYAAESLEFEQGVNNGTAAVAVTIAYRPAALKPQQILRVTGMEAATEAIEETLSGCNSGLVMLVSDFEEMDVDQLVQNMALDNPQAVMEIPKISQNLYGSGSDRVVELTFTYENSREDLRQMQTQVKRIFDSSTLYISADAEDSQKFSQLYTFLMERFDYVVETSITPSYSLLYHGVGDSRAFATVFAAMCRNVGLECEYVTGTRQGEPWVWNLVWEGDMVYHVDLLACSAEGDYRERADDEMQGYVWDYSAYPASVRPEPETVPPDTTETVPETQPEQPIEESDTPTESIAPPTEPPTEPSTEPSTETALPEPAV